MEKEIKIYSTPSCHFCKKAKDFFKKHNIEYTEIDVSKDKEAKNKMIEISEQMGVPVIVINDEVLVGYNEAKLKVVCNVK